MPLQGSAAERIRARPRPWRYDPAMELLVEMIDEGGPVPPEMRLAAAHYDARKRAKR